MTVSEQAAIIVLLQRRGRRRWSEISAEVEERGSALAVLRDGVGQRNLWPDDLGSELESAQRSIDSWKREGMNFASLLNDDYPNQLLTIHQRPPFVMWSGRRDQHDARGVAVVGTRTPSEKGLRQARSMASKLARRGVPVISGLARGIDTAAHLGALEAGGRTVAVLGNGLRVAYPPENRGLQERLFAEGMVLSQFFPDVHPSRVTFPMRNAIMSGYAAATVVIEATFTSGARMQARLALEHGRPIFLMESLREHEWARHYGSRPGAQFVDTADDVMSALDRMPEPVGELVWA